MLFRTALSVFSVLSVLALGLALLPACRSTPVRPAKPGPDPTVRRLADPKELQPYLDAYPLGDDDMRADLLAHDGTRSMHLVQLRAPLRRHRHPGITETGYVLTGRGELELDGTVYPAIPGSAFRIDPGRPHGVVPEAGVTLVALVYFEPPQLGPIPREFVEE